MAFFKFRQRGQPAAEPGRRANAPAAAGAMETVDSLRRRARHRLAGAAVLVLVAVIGFPLLFDTQPRPVSVDAPITIPDKDRVAPLRGPGAGSGSRGSVSTSASLGDREEIVAPSASGARASAAAAAPAARPAERSADDDARARREAEAKAKREDESKAKRDEEAKAKREEEAKAKREEESKARRDEEAKAKREAEQRAQREEAARARALLEGRAKPPTATTADASADTGRFIIQIGAYAEADAVREVRQQAERAGVKTYTQVVDTKDGKRTRVRVGPYPSRAEAEKAAAALKKAGLGGSILSL